jgi:hypothetical protein
VYSSGSEVRQSLHTFSNAEVGNAWKFIPTLPTVLHFLALGVEAKLAICYETKMSTLSDSVCFSYNIKELKFIYVCHLSLLLSLSQPNILLSKNTADIS